MCGCIYYKTYVCVDVIVVRGGGSKFVVYEFIIRHVAHCMGYVVFG